MSRALKSGEHFQKDEVWRMHLVACQDALDRTSLLGGGWKKKGLNETLMQTTSFGSSGMSIVYVLTTDIPTMTYNPLA